MKNVIKIAGCAALALLCVAVPILTVLSIVYQWSASLSTWLVLLCAVVAFSIFAALMNVK